MIDMENKFRGTFYNGSQNKLFAGNNLIPKKQSYAQSVSANNMGFNIIKQPRPILYQPKTQNLSPRLVKTIPQREYSAVVTNQRGRSHYQDNLFHKNTSRIQVKKQLMTSKSDYFQNYGDLKP